jgi:hypothetical protein
MDLWCMHIPGPDDVYATPSREAAQEMADKHNEAMRRFWERHPRTEHDPSDAALTAVVVPWMWSAEDHADALSKGA